jgi:UPF0755 protein
MTKKRLLIVSISIIIIVGSIISINFYNKIYRPNITTDRTIYIKSNTDINAVIEALAPYLGDINSFKWVANKKNYPNIIKAGKFDLTKGMSNNDIINLLRSGNQKVLILSFNNQDSLEKLAGRIANQIEPDSLTILKVMKDLSFLSKNNFTKENALAMYIPNSYQFYWNTSAEKFRNKMLGEFHKFWTNDLKELAAAQKLSIFEVIILASIVQKETQTISERPEVARLYLNRLHNKWPLQADPTVIFAIKEKQGQDAVIKRVLLKDLKIDSKYNTYKNTGLPPGPISMPDISSIKAVLKPGNHNYFYMCADIENFGNHVFARTLAQHNRNAVKYQQWISKQGIVR